MICCISMAIVSLKRATNYIIRGLVRREENKERMTSLFGRRRERAAAARAWFYWHSCVYAGATGQGRRRTTTTTGLRERSEMIATDLCLSLSLPSPRTQNCSNFCLQRDQQVMFTLKKLRIFCWFWWTTLKIKKMSHFEGKRTVSSLFTNFVQRAARCLRGNWRAVTISQRWKSSNLKGSTVVFARLQDASPFSAMNHRGRRPSLKYRHLQYDISKFQGMRHLLGVEQRETIPTSRGKTRQYCWRLLQEGGGGWEEQHEMEDKHRVGGGLL